MSNWWDADPVASVPRVTVTPRARDLLTRTVLGEAANEPDEGQAAVAAVIRNRVQSGRWGDDPLKVITAKNQFEPWNTQEGRSRMFSYAPDSPEYKRAAAAVDRAFNDGFDPTEGATHFYSPTAQAALGRQPPAWAQGEGRAIGRHTFYAPEGRVQVASAQPQQPSGNWWDADPVAGAPSARITVNPVAERFAEPPKPENAEALQEGLQERARDITTGPRTTPTQSMAISQSNILPAAEQRATSNIDILSKNLISTEVHEGDDGSILYRDPQTGAVVPTDNTKHIVMRDPADNTVKVYARTDEATESPALGLSRVLLQGMVSGAPTARAAIPAVAAPKPGQTVANAAERIGVQVPRAVATDSMALQRTAAAARNIPVAGDPLIRGAERAINQLGAKADEVAAGYGAANTTVSGDAARTGINRYVTETTKAKAGQLYDKVDELAGHASGGLNATQVAVRRILARRGEAALPEGEATNLVKEALGRGMMSYEGIKTLRSNVGEYIDAGILPAGMSQGELKQIYEGLTRDLEAVVRTAGPQAYAAFRRANSYYRLAAERNAALAKIVGKDGNAPVEQVFDRLVAMASSSSRADIAKLSQARKAMGADDWNEFVSGVVSRMGRDPAVKGAPEALHGADFSPQRFLTAYGKLSPEGRAMLFRSGGKSGLADSLNDIATVSSRFRELQKFANPSGTGQTVMGGIGIAAIIADPVTTLTTLVGGRVAAQILSQPAKAASAAQWARSYERLAKTPSTPRLAQFELATRNLLNNVRDLGVDLSPADFLRALQGPVKSAAEGEEQPVPGRPGE